MKSARLSCLVLLACLGCSSPSLVGRPVVTEPTWFIRLDRDVSATPASAPLNEHPKEWTEEDLQGILGRLFLQERVGIMDRVPPPRPVFSPEEVSLLAPGLRQAFHLARPSEWVVVYLSRPQGPTSEITSGGLFVKSGNLHVVIANHREPVQGSGGDEGQVRANPLRSVRGTRGSLTFDPPKFVMETGANWSGGYAASASELVLDHAAFLASMRPAAPLALAPPPQPGPGVVPRPPPVTGPVPRAESATAVAASGGASAGAGDAALQDRVLTLQAEIERLKRRVEEQEREVAHLKERVGQLSPRPAAPKRPE